MTNAERMRKLMDELAAKIDGTEKVVSEYTDEGKKKLTENDQNSE